MATAVGRFQARLLAYCVMPSPWHFVVWSRTDRGVEAWRKEVSARLGLESTFRGPGRPRKAPGP